MLRGSYGSGAFWDSIFVIIRASRYSITLIRAGSVFRIASRVSIMSHLSTGRMRGCSLSGDEEWRDEVARYEWRRNGEWNGVCRRCVPMWPVELMGGGGSQARNLSWRAKDNALQEVPSMKPA